MASSGCRTVVNDGADSDDNGTSSNPITEHCSGTFTPALVSARIAPSAVRSSNASSAVKRFFFCNSSSVKRCPPSKLKLGSSESGSCTTSAGSISRSGGLRGFLNPAPSRRAVDQHFRPANIGDFAVAQLDQCSSARRPPASLSTITELTVSPGNSHPMVAAGISRLPMSASR